MLLLGWEIQSFLGRLSRNLQLEVSDLILEAIDFALELTMLDLILRRHFFWGLPAHWLVDIVGIIEYFEAFHATQAARSLVGAKLRLIYSWLF